MSKRRTCEQERTPSMVPVTPVLRNCESFTYLFSRSPPSEGEGKTHSLRPKGGGGGRVTSSRKRPHARHSSLSSTRTPLLPAEHMVPLRIRWRPSLPLLHIALPASPHLFTHEFFIRATTGQARGSDRPAGYSLRYIKYHQL